MIRPASPSFPRTSGDVSGAYDKARVILDAALARRSDEVSTLQDARV